MYFACAFVDLGIQNAMHKRHISSVACPAPPYSSLSSHKRLDFQNTVIEHKMYVFISSTIVS